jgi:hypothetical protein
MDFSAAVVGATPDLSIESKRASPRGIPTYINFTGRMVRLRASGTALGRDSQGNWWMQWTLRKGMWSAIEASLSELADTTV